MPCAKPRSRTGSQKVNARVAAGNAPPSPTPTRMRKPTSEATLQDSAGQDGRGRPQQAQDREHQARAEPIRQPAAGNLHGGVRIGERREDEPELGGRQPQLLPHRRSGHRDVHAIDVGDEVHQAEDEQHQVPDLQRQSGRTSHSRFTPIRINRSPPRHRRRRRTDQQDRSLMIYCGSNSLIGRTSTLPSRAGGIFEADLDRVVQVSRLDQVEAGQLLLGLGERTVGDRHPAVPHPHGRRGLDRLERLGGDQQPALPESVTAGDTLAVGHGAQLLLLRDRPGTGTS